jgi:GMP synthase (glutamine-hydrolysing)
MLGEADTEAVMGGAGAPGSEETAPQTVIVLDFGGQYAQLIARRVRELNVYSVLLPHDTPWDRSSPPPVAIILSGGPASVYDRDAPQADPRLWSGDIPVLGICYGAQLMAHQLGGRVAPAERREFGPATVTPAVDEPLLNGVPDGSPVWMSHGDSILQLPPGFRVIASSPSTPFAALANDRGLMGLQFHPEVVHTPSGRDILANFTLGIAGARGDWTPASYVESAISAIRAEVGSERVICALSGGVDSAVAATLVHRAVGDQLTCVYVDTGLMRSGSRSAPAPAAGTSACRSGWWTEDPFIDLAGSSIPRRAQTDRRGSSSSRRRGRLGPIVPGPGNAVPRRYRVQDRPVQGGGQDQDPPQRGWAPR